MTFCDILLDIAIQLMEQQKTGLIDVILGGGLKNFMPKDQKTHFNGTSERNDSRNLVATWENDGGKVVYDIDELTNVEANDLPVLGLFADSHMGYDALRRSSSKEPTLQSMTTKAIKLLVENNEDGFFLLVEGARIDHGQHANKPYLTLTEGKHFDVKKVKKFFSMFLAVTSNVPNRTPRPQFWLPFFPKGTILRDPLL